MPGGVEQAAKDADTCFSMELGVLTEWAFGAEQAKAIEQPVLSVVGSNSYAMFTEGRELLHSLFAKVEDFTLEGAGHLLQMQRPEPVAKALATSSAATPSPPGSPRAQRRDRRTEVAGGWTRFGGRLMDGVIAHPGLPVDPWVTAVRGVYTDRRQAHPNRCVLQRAKQRHTVASETAFRGRRPHRRIARSGALRADPPADGDIRGRVC